MKYRKKPVEEKFEGGQEVWVIERGYGERSTVSCYVFITEVNNYAIVSPFLGESGEVDFLLESYAEETEDSFRSELLVFKMDDCYDSEEQAMEGVKRYD